MHDQVEGNGDQASRDSSADALTVDAINNGNCDGLVQDLQLLEEMRNRIAVCMRTPMFDCVHLSGIDHSTGDITDATVVP